MMAEGVKSRLDRELQGRILEHLQDAFPNDLYMLDLFPGVETEALLANLIYLEQSGLCATDHQGEGVNRMYTGRAEINNRGLDFLAADGGLSAILGVVTIRMHADTVRDLIAARIQASNVTHEEKSMLRKHLATLSETALRAATTDLVRTGLDHLPDAIHWLRTLAGS